MSLSLPDGYGYVVLGNLVFPFFMSFYMGGNVMAARDKFNVDYPNLYATPGYHKEADAFNRVQRGHQAMFEALLGVTAMSLVGGLKHPIAATIAGLSYSVGSLLYQLGYADTSHDVKNARFKKGGAIKYIGVFTSVGTCISVAGTMNGWW